MTLRERLAAIRKRTATHRLRVEDDAAPREELAAAIAGGDTERIAAAQRALDACHETLHLVALAPADWDALVAAHPLDGRGDGWFDPVTFLPAALAACVQDDEITEADWTDYTTKGAMAPGEVRALLDDVVALHGRAPDPSVPKDSTGTPS